LFSTHGRLICHDMSTDNSKDITEHTGLGKLMHMRSYDFLRRMILIPESDSMLIVLNTDNDKRTQIPWNKEMVYCVLSQTALLIGERGTPGDTIAFVSIDDSTAHSLSFNSVELTKALFGGWDMYAKDGIIYYQDLTGKLMAFEISDLSSFVVMSPPPGSLGTGFQLVDSVFALTYSTKAEMEIRLYGLGTKSLLRTILCDRAYYTGRSDQLLRSQGHSYTMIRQMDNFFSAGPFDYFLLNIDTGEINKLSQFTALYIDAQFDGFLDRGLAVKYGML
jgi:hypothetical protein